MPLAAPVMSATFPARFIERNLCSPVLDNLSSDEMTRFFAVLAESFVVVSSCQWLARINFPIMAMLVIPDCKSRSFLRAEARQLKEALAEATLENSLLKKSVIADGEEGE